jgi:hypothetical protein
MRRIFLLLAFAMVMPAGASAQLRVGSIMTYLDTSRPDSATRLTGAVMISLAQDIGRWFVTPPPGLTIEGRRCGESNAFYVPALRRIVLCIELAQELELRFIGFTDGDWGAARDNAFQAELFLALHELAHAVVHIYGLPVIGRDEDAADQFAIWWLLRNQNVRIAAIAVFTFSLWSQESPPVHRMSEYADIHSLPEQRFLNLRCWLTGSGLDRNLGADWLTQDLPKSRLDSCRSEFVQLSTSWRRLLADRIRTVPAPTPAPQQRPQG